MAFMIKNMSPQMRLLEEPNEVIRNEEWECEMER